ncbi:MAG TPA: hypothetical protein VE981_06820 [Planctomycetota bacterium]|nr:hypothetical protein [Planctomycetota bacterium]
MSIAAMTAMLMGGVLGSLLVYELVLSRPARILSGKPFGSAPKGLSCSSCGRAETLSILTTSSNEDSSPDLAVYCSRCGASRGPDLGSSHRINV